MLPVRVEEAEKRSGYGDEIYEQRDTQATVKRAFE
ncbi:hypothetical protein KIPB_017299, partial [Kipferlia bialata]|eukprot:g17299.t1